MLQQSIINYKEKLFPDESEGEIVVLLSLTILFLARRNQLVDVEVLVLEFGLETFCTTGTNSSWYDILPLGNSFASPEIIL